MASIRDATACNKAARLLAQGQPVATYIRGVCGLWADGESEPGLDAIYQIKGERRGGRPVGTTLPAAEFIEKLNPDDISSSLHGLMLNMDELARRLGSLCFIRAPIKDEVGESLPERLVSRSDDGTYWIQNWLPEGCRSARHWMESIGEQGISLPVATSMNVSGEPEIVDQEEGRKFARARGVPMFLADPDDPGRARGSFPILQVDSAGIKLLREGHFTAKLFQLLLSGWHIDLSHYQTAKYPVAELPQASAELGKEPSQLRRTLLEFLDG